MVRRAQSGYQPYDTDSGVTEEIGYDVLKPSLPDSWDFYFAQMGMGNFYLDPRKPAPTIRQYPDRRFRLRGTIATPLPYCPAIFAERSDAIIYLNETTAAGRQ
ncbi:MAG: hypothetical protein WA952_08805 [Lewinella sp.]